MDFVQIELDGCLCIKRIEKFRTPEGQVDLDAIRLSFEEFGYSVGRILSVQ